VRIASLTHEIVQPARFVRQQSSVDCYAVFNLRLTPVVGLRSICFANEAQKPEVEPRITAAIEKGVMQFARDSEEQGRPVGGLKVTPFDISVHPVDGRDICFTIAAYHAMKEAFEAHGTLVDIGAEQNL
jgi:elongation factor G